MLTDGRILVVEYKGEDRFDNPDSIMKRRIGELWAEASGGHCLFAMPTRGDFRALDEMLGTVDSAD